MTQFMHNVGNIRVYSRVKGRGVGGGRWAIARYACPHSQPHDASQPMRALLLVLLFSGARAEELVAANENLGVRYRRRTMPAPDFSLKGQFNAFAIIKVTSWSVLVINTAACCTLQGWP